MNRNKVLFGFVNSKSIESADSEEDIGECSTTKRERSQSSMLYQEALKRELLRSPVTR